MMLRASTASQLQPPDPDSTSDDVVGRRSPNLEDFVGAVVGTDAAAAEAARADLVDQFGTEWLVDASAVIANFEMMTRLADATGACLRPEQLVASASMRDELGLDAFPSART
jgi:hypothetical protein